MMRRQPLSWGWLIPVAMLALLLTACQPGSRAADPTAPAGEVSVRVEVTPLQPPTFSSASDQLPVTQVVAATPAPAATVTPAAPSASDFDAQVVTAWFDLAYRLVRDEKLPPPLASRLFAYAGVALWEAVAPGAPNSTSLAGQLNELVSLPQPYPQTEYYWPAVANSALATLLRTLYAGASGSTLRAIDDLEHQFASQFQTATPPEVWQRSAAQGELVGLAIFRWAQSDGFAFLNNCPYTPPSALGLWEPTPPGLAAPLQPCWGQMRPFVLRERSDECQPKQKPAYSEDTDSQFYLEAREIYQVVNNLTPEQQEIARFWSDDTGKTGTPPGHSVSILTQIVREQNLPLDRAAEAYARLGIALADSFISCWQTKFAANVPRPVTFIQKVIDPKWSSLLTTPPFPEYTSGHSAQSGAAAVVLSALFGENYAFVDHTHDALGFAPRSFASFEALANEAAISRLYGGIHFRSAIEAGLEQGKCIGQRVDALKFRQ